MRTIGLQEGQGAFSDGAARSVRPGTETRGYETFDALVAAVADGTVDEALLPVENAIFGSIARSYDLLWEYAQLHAVAETVFPVEMCLIGTLDADESTIREVRSHPVALEQVHKFAKLHPDWKRVAVADTAGAVAEIVGLGDRTVAAIGPALAAELYGAKILQAAIQDDPRNFSAYFSRRAGLATAGLRAIDRQSTGNRPRRFISRSRDRPALARRAAEPRRSVQLPLLLRDRCGRPHPARRRARRDPGHRPDRRHFQSLLNGLRRLAARADRFGERELGLRARVDVDVGLGILPVDEAADRTHDPAAAGVQDRLGECCRGSVEAATSWHSTLRLGLSVERRAQWCARPIGEIEAIEREVDPGWSRTACTTWLTCPARRR